MDKWQHAEIDAGDDFGLDFVQKIYSISPEGTPFDAYRIPRYALSPNKGGSMRKQRRRKAKPLRFTASRVFGWTVSPEQLAKLHKWR
jgi:hypothetical protein